MYNFQLNDLFLLPLPKQRPEHVGKATVVLDLDETLVHSIFIKDIERLFQSNYNKADKTIRRIMKKSDLFLPDVRNYGSVAVFFRPGLHRFLCKLSKMFEVVLWTASNRKYAKPILDYIDPNGDLLPYRLFREHTILTVKDELVKDLTQLGRNMARTVLVDNNPLTVRRAPSNVYLIPDFYGDPKDAELPKAWTFLREMTDSHDFRPHLEAAVIMIQRKAKDPEERPKKWVWKKVFINETQFKYQKVLA